MKKESKPNPRIIRRAASLFLSAVLLGGTLLTAGCSTSAKKELNVFVWTEYMPDTVFKAFEKEYGVKVNVTTYSSNEDMLAKIKGSNEGIYDIVVPSDYMVKMMISEGLLQKLDQKKMTNLTNMDTSFLNQSFDPGNAYSVPYMGGVVALCVNTKMVKEDITSFSQIFDPKYKGSLVLLDDFRAVIGETSKSLGYSLNTTDDKELTAVGNKLAELKPNVKLLDSDSPKTAMLNGETSIGYMWNAEIAICMQESPDFKIVFPSEGTYMFLDNLCITKGAKNSDTANDFLNFLMRPEISKLVSDEYPYLNPNKAAVALLPDSYKNSPASNIPSDVIAKGEYVQDIGTTVEKYDQLWTTFTE